MGRQGRLSLSKCGLFLRHVKNKETLPVISSASTATTGDELALYTEIEALKVREDATILAHYYQDGEIQDLADFTGDSLKLAGACELRNLLAGSRQRDPGNVPFVLARARSQARRSWWPRTHGLFRARPASIHSLACSTRRPCPYPESQMSRI